jgi:hypothetical protein
MELRRWHQRQQNSFRDENDSETTSKTVSVNCANELSNTHKETLDFEIKNENLSNSEKEKLKQFLLKNRDVFSTSLANMGKTDWYKHRIEFPPATQVRSAPYRVDQKLNKNCRRTVTLNYLKSCHKCVSLSIIMLTYMNT